MQISCFSLKFHPLVLAFSSGSYLQQLLLWWSNGDFLFLSFFTFINWNFHLRKIRPFHFFVYSIAYLHQYGLTDIYFILWSCGCLWRTGSPVLQRHPQVAATKIRADLCKSSLLGDSEALEHSRGRARQWRPPVLVPGVFPQAPRSMCKIRRLPLRLQHAYKNLSHRSAPPIFPVSVNGTTLYLHVILKSFFSFTPA